MKHICNYSVSPNQHIYILHLLNTCTPIYFSMLINIYFCNTGISLLNNKAFDPIYSYADTWWTNTLDSQWVSTVMNQWSIQLTGQMTCDYDVHE